MIPVEDWNPTLHLTAISVAEPPIPVKWGRSEVHFFSQNWDLENFQHFEILNLARDHLPIDTNFNVKNNAMMYHTSTYIFSMRLKIDMKPP